MDTKALAAYLLLLVAPVAAHEPSDGPILALGTYLHHMNHYEGTLEPGAWNNTTLA